jgi:hypothetical protein
MPIHIDQADMSRFARSTSTKRRSMACTMNLPAVTAQRQMAHLTIWQWNQKSILQAH